MQKSLTLDEKCLRVDWNFFQENGPVAEKITRLKLKEQEDSAERQEGR